MISTLISFIGKTDKKPFDMLLLLLSGWLLVILIAVLTLGVFGGIWSLWFYLVGLPLLIWEYLGKSADLFIGQLDISGCSLSQVQEIGTGLLLVWFISLLVIYLAWLWEWRRVSGKYRMIKVIVLILSLWILFALTTGIVDRFCVFR